MKPNVYSVTTIFSKEPSQVQNGVKAGPWYRVDPELCSMCGGPRKQRYGICTGCESKLYGRNNGHLQR